MNLAATPPPGEDTLQLDICEQLDLRGSLALLKEQRMPEQRRPSPLLTAVFSVC